MRSSTQCRWELGMALTDCWYGLQKTFYGPVSARLLGAGTWVSHMYIIMTKHLTEGA